MNNHEEYNDFKTQLEQIYKIDLQNNDKCNEN